MLAQLLRLQVLAFRRAPYFGGRVVLSALKALGLAYAFTVAAALGFLLPDTLSVWAPEVSALGAVERALLPALASLTVARVVFQDVPTRGAEAFLLLPFDRRRVARAVGLRSLATPFNGVPLAFVAPFAARTVRAEAGAAAAWSWALGVAALVALSHVALVVWKTRLGERPVDTLLRVAGVAAALVAAELALGGLVPRLRAPDGLLWIGAIVVAAAWLAVHAYRGLVGALYLDARPGAARRPRAAAPSEAPRGFAQPGVPAFLDLDVRQVLRTRYPRGLAVNAAVVGVALALLGLVGDGEGPTQLIVVFAVSTVAVSLGQFAVPFASGHYDRLLTLPGAVPAFARAKLVLVLGGVGGVALLQTLLALAVAALGLADAWQAVLWLGVGGLFSAGVMAPVSVLASTLGPKPIDTRDRVMMNYKVQSLPAQLAIGATGLAAVGLALALGDAGWVVLGFAGAAGLAALPLWERALVRRIRHTRHAVAARFRTTL